MNQDFFGVSGDTAIQSQSQQYGQEHFQSQDNAPDDQFEFQDQGHYVGIETLQQQNYNPTTYQPDTDAIRKIQQEQARVQDKLREKANREYEEKQKRKQEGRKQLQEFLAKKQKQTTNRKQENIGKEKQLLNKNAKLSEEAGWKKVAANIALKQGQNKGQKDITRMRESIINKRNDETN